ncbi:MAG: dihydrofolate reductase family protein, partial [Pseudomonadota bacterium]
LAQTAPNQPVWLVHRHDADPERRAAWGALGAELIACDTDAKERLDPVALLKALGARGITRVFCEGGGQLAASLLRADCVDRLVEMRAGLALGAEGLPAIAKLGLTSLADAPRFELDDMALVGPDAVLEWRRVDGAYRQNGPNLSAAP